MGRPKKNTTTEGRLEESLIPAVFKRPCLYDIRDKNYSQTKKKERIWKEISGEVNTDVQICKTRWRSLRDTFKKVDQKARATKSGDGLEDVDDKSTDWPWYTSLVFLRESNYNTKTTDSISPSETEEAIERDILDPGSLSRSTEDNNLINNDSGPSKPAEKKAEKRKNSASQWNSVMENLKEVVKGSTAGSESTSESFALYVAKEMDEMSDIEKIDFKYDVMGIIRSLKRARLSTRVIQVEVSGDIEYGLN